MPQPQERARDLEPAVQAIAPAPVPAPRSRFGRLTEPQILFPAVAIAILAIIWGTTWNLIRVQHAAAGNAIINANIDLTDTYEAQVIRALREIDQALNVVRFALRIDKPDTALAQLKERDLLPPELLFTVSVVDARGAFVARTRAGDDTPFDADFLRQMRTSDELVISRPTRGGGHDWLLHFGRRATGSDLAVVISVDASYFVSSYDMMKLGNDGVLALLGTDGVFRVLRTGETVRAGSQVDYARTVTAGADDISTVNHSANTWDGVRRYWATRKLFDFPVAVIVGLSEDELMAPTLQNSRTFLIRASLGSALVIVVCILLGRLSWQLARTRLREGEARVAYAERIEYMAFHDALTALPNRSLFNRLLTKGIEQARHNGSKLAVAFVDLDRFKQINDTLGHEAGDELLKAVAARFSNCLRETDIVARLGGDEFVLLLTDLTQEQYATQVAQRVVAAASRPFTLLGQEFRVTASMGISLYPKDGLDEQTLTKNADIAMYRAKEEGKNNFQFYNPDFSASSLERLALESSLRHALGNNEFQLNYQARRDIGTGRITGVEALLRWQHPDLGSVAPTRFLPIAEETGLIVPIGRWVLETACRQSVIWQRRGLPRLPIAVNLTARQFRDENLITDVASVFANTGMDPQLLEIEIHESLLVHDVERTLQKLTQLKAMGVRIAIDDFGTGYSSLVSLQRFPLDTIKIDRNFIRDVTTRDDNSALTDAIITIGRSLSVTVVAQGVETSEQAEFLRAHACDELQGFYFKAPLAAEPFTTLLQAQSAEIEDFDTIVRRMGKPA